MNSAKVKMKSLTGRIVKVLSSPKVIKAYESIGYKLV